jgi:CRP/FNR family cyclic AMP-dependent transcriptional regulator
MRSIRAAPAIWGCSSSTACSHGRSRWAAAALSSVPIDSHWTVVERTRVAVLDRRFATTMASFPEITGAILDRVTVRSRWLSFYLAVVQLKLVEERLLVVLWHFADRWGHVRPDGVVVRVPITQKLLGGVVGARRPSVTTALSRLRRAGQVERLPGGEWLLHGGPPDALGRIEKQAVGRPLADDGSAA